MSIPSELKNWKTVVALVLLLTTFAAGRFSAPTKTITSTTAHAEQTTAKTDTHTEAKTEAKTVIVYRDRTVVTHSDGTTERRNVETTTTADKVADKTAERAADVVTKIDDKTALKTVQKDAPRLHINALAADDIAHMGEPSFGAQVEYRIAGPVWVGVLGLSSGTFAVSVGLEF